MEYDITINEFGHKSYYDKTTKELIKTEFSNGDVNWFKDTYIHREDGPALEWADGNKFWYIKGMLHRTDGPAVEWTNGYKQWWINGKRLFPEKEAILNQWWDNKNGI